MNEINMEEIEGFSFGQAESPCGLTGCTVVLSEQGATAGVNVRGGSPGTRETDLLRSENLIQQIHGVFLSGGSAFGLDVGTGVMKFLEEKDIGFDVDITHVPIVPGAILFDLIDRTKTQRPDAKMGYQAAERAFHNTSIKQGNYGAGAGASVGKALGSPHSMKGGIGSYACQIGDIKVGALIAVNCFGDVIDPESGTVVAGLQTGGRFLNSERRLIEQMRSTSTNLFSQNTTIGVVVTNAKVDKPQANKLASQSHDGFARAIRPSHTFVDGDTLFFMGHTDGKSCDLNSLGALATICVERAIVRAVRYASTTPEFIAARDIHKKGD